MILAVTVSYSSLLPSSPTHAQVEIIANDQGNRITPSYVAFDAEERLVPTTLRPSPRGEGGGEGGGREREREREREGGRRCGQSLGTQANHIIQVPVCVCVSGRRFGEEAGGA